MITPDFNSNTWKFIKERCEERIANFRKLNDSLAMDQIATAHLRGLIAAYKQMAELPETLSREKTRLADSRQNAGEE